MLSRSRRPAVRHAASAGLALLGFVGEARAHIDLREPQPREHGPSRDPNSNVKSGPCGQEVNGRTDRVSVFEPGATIEVTWDETTNHRSYYRVAFDVDGDDAFPTFLGNGVGTEGIDPQGLCPADGQVILAYDMDDRSGGSHTLAVRLPDVECERCTLQVIQFMYDTGRPYYFQCADLALRRSRATGASPDGGALDAGSGDAGALSAASAAGVSEPSPSAAPGCSSRIAPDPPPRNDDDDDDDRPPPPPAARPSPSPPETADAPSRSDSGCSIDSQRRSGANVMPWLFLIGAGAISRTWRRRRESAAG